MIKIKFKHFKPIGITAIFVTLLFLAVFQIIESNVEVGLNNKEMLFTTLTH